jgi:hypothetical protein
MPPCRLRHVSHAARAVFTVSLPPPPPEPPLTPRLQFSRRQRLYAFRIFRRHYFIRLPLFSDIVLMPNTPAFATYMPPPQPHCRHYAAIDISFASHTPLRYFARAAGAAAFRQAGWLTPDFLSFAPPDAFQPDYADAASAILLAG